MILFLKAVRDLLTRRGRVIELLAYKDGAMVGTSRVQ
jgi:hypothetical protein